MRATRPGDAVSGTVTRLISASPRQRLERFALDVDGMDPVVGAPHGDEVVLGSVRWHGIVGEPIRLWEGVIDADTRSDARERFSGNLDVDTATAPVVVDAHGREPLGEEAFWGILETLGGRASEASLAAATRRLAQETDDRIIAWAQAAGRHALDLAGSFDRAGIRAGDQLHLIGATLARGPVATAAAVTNAESADPAWMSDTSPQVIWLGSSALSRRRGAEHHVLTDFTERHAAILTRARADVVRWQRERGITPDAPRPSYRAVRALVEIAHHCRERVILHPDGVGRLVDPVESLTLWGGAVLSVEIMPGGLAGIFPVDALRVRRRSTLPLDLYRARFTTSPLPLS